MLYLLLLKNSLRQHKTGYVYVFIVVLLSVFTVAFFSVFADSVSYGEQLLTLQMTHGADIKIDNAAEEDVSLFSSLENVSIWYEDGSIYISCDSNSNADTIAYRTVEIIRESGKDLHSILYDSSLKESYFEQDFVTVIEFIICIISLLSIYYIFNVFVECQQNDFLVCKSLGFSINQFSVIIGIEFLSVFILAVILAIPLAGLVMKTMITLDFQTIIPNSSIGYAVYRFTLKKKLFVVVLTFLTIAFAYFMTIYKYFGVHSLGKSLRDFSYFKRSDSVMNKKSIYSMMPCLKFHRNRKLTYISILLLLPVFGYAVISINQGDSTYEKKYGSDFIISDPKNSDVSTLAQEDIDELLDFACVDTVQYTYYNNNFNQLGADLSNPYAGRIAFQIVYDNSIPENQFFIDKAYSDQYALGNKVAVVSSHKNQTYEITVDGYFESAAKSSYLTIYCTMESFSALTGIDSTPRNLFVYLKDNTTDAEINAFREWIDKTFVSYSDENLEVEHNAIAHRRINTTNIIATVSMIISVSITLFAILMFEIDSRYNEIAIMSGIGADKNQLQRLISIEMLFRGILCSALIIAIDIVIKLLMHSDNNMSNNFEFKDLLVYIGVTLFISANFIIPSKITLSNILSKQKKEMGYGNTEDIRFE